MPRGDGMINRVSAVAARERLEKQTEQTKTPVSGKGEQRVLELVRWTRIAATRKEGMKERVV